MKSLFCVFSLWTPGLKPHFFSALKTEVNDTRNKDFLFKQLYFYEQMFTFNSD